MSVLLTGEGALRTGFDLTEDVKNNLRAHFGQVTGDIQTLGSGFQGQASVAFNQLMVQWNDECNNINKALGDFQDSLNLQAQHLQTGEEEQRTQFSNIASRLGGN